MSNHEKEDRDQQNAKAICLRLPLRLAKALEADAGDRLLSVSARCRQILAAGVGFKTTSA